MAEKKISQFVQQQANSPIPWFPNRQFYTNDFCYSNNILLQCKASHVSNASSIIPDIQASRWFPVSSYPLTKSQREAIITPIDGTQIRQTDDIPFIYTYQNGQWMLQNYTASFIRNVGATKQAPVVNTAIKLGITECILGSSISYNNTTGIFTLQGGGIYDFKAGVGTCYANVAAYIITSWQMSTDMTNWSYIGNSKMELTSSNTWGNVPASSDAGGTQEFNQTTYLRYVPMNISGVTQIGDASTFTQGGTKQTCWAEIREIARNVNFKVNVQTDADISMIQKTYGSVYRSTGSSPAQSVGTSPTNVLFTNGGENTGVTQTLNSGTPFTITKAGVYLIIGAVHSDTDGATGSDFNGIIAKNGVSISGTSRTWGDADHCVALNTTTYCNIGDTISLQAWGGISASLKGASLSIVQIA